MNFIILLLLFCVVCVGIYVYRAAALRGGWLDIPNERSSHAHPVPRGAGIVFVAAVCLYAVYLYLAGEMDKRLFFALIWGVVLALVGFWDDLRSLDIKFRFAVQAIVAAAAVAALGDFAQPHSDLGLFRTWWGLLLAWVWIVMMINIFNFLDGIDGYAAMQGIVIGLTAVVFFHSPFGLALGVALAGFLMFNWHKASVFMGDAGSTVLGYWFGVLSLYHAEGAVVWLSVSTLFWIDALLTILKRLFAKERIWQAHKKHAYQKLVRMGWSHDKVVLGAVLYYGLVLTALGVGIDPVAVLIAASAGAAWLWIWVQKRDQIC